MNAAHLNPEVCAAFLLTAVTLAGACQTAWLASPWSSRFTQPLDLGVTLRGRRLFGVNKTVRGFLVMVPASGLSFVLLASLLDGTSSGAMGLWRASPEGYLLLGVVAGLGFMAGELPNSFIKRQLDVLPGEAAEGRLLRPLCFLMDRVDSAAGLLVALSLLVEVPWRTAVYVALAGPAIHGLFSVALFRLGVKARAA
jgi:CDP-2,3-bis-(O-geranylgeranyl)-sn-glycerol synthase